MAFTHTHTQPRVLALFFSFFSEIKNRKRLKILFIFRRIDDFLFLISGKKKKKTTKDEKNLLNGGGKKKKKKKGHREKTMAISYFSSPSLYFSQMFCLSFFLLLFLVKYFSHFFPLPPYFYFFFPFLFLELMLQITESPERSA
jgi:hypothetical protein